MVLRDTQRKRLYDAESDMFFNSEWTDRGASRIYHPPLDFATPRELQQFVNKVARSKFWRECGGRVQILGKAIPSWRGNAAGYEMQVHIPPWAMCKPTVLHELTHTLMYRLSFHAADHGPEFVLVLRRLIEDHMGTEVRQAFDRQLETKGVKWGIGSIPPGKIAPGISDST